LKRRYAMLICLSLTACGGEDARRGQAADSADLQPDAIPLATTLVYECNGYEFIARHGAGEIALWLEDRYVVLAQVRSASGALYEEGEVSFWSKGDEAMLTVDEQIYQNCHLVPARVPWEDARRRGVDFRGVGNEPGWSLEIQDGRQLLFVGQYGAQRVMVPAAVAENVGPARVYHGATGTYDLRVEIVDEPCADTMSGETFPSQVTVTLDNTAYQGCGQHLDYPWEE
jgi:membrane-bound inhibitor of C-type lysozyme